MKSFNDDNFLLQSPTAERLYHEHAAKQPRINFIGHEIVEGICHKNAKNYFKF